MARLAAFTRHGYGFEESIRDVATLKLHFEPRLIDLHINKEALDAAYKNLTGSLSDLDKDMAPHLYLRAAA